MDYFEEMIQEYKKFGKAKVSEVYRLGTKWWFSVQIKNTIWSKDFETKDSAEKERMEALHAISACKAGPQ